MNWIFQKEGQINHFNPKIHLGTQPIRVVNPMIVFMFQNTHPRFIEEIRDLVDENKLNKQLNMIFGEEAILSTMINTPRISSITKKIEIHETFLSYLWSISYAIYTLYLETIDFPFVNKKTAIIHILLVKKIF